ncbi:MAG: hypothetical protein JWQ71_1038 [Pedosphaera sp.]|nr:hypothetical protein [Pedosphaera sp.]
MVDYNDGWMLEVTTKGEIFVTHHGKPRFKVQIIIKPANPSFPEPSVSFKGQWEEKAVDAMPWYLKALEFYHFAMKQRTQS